MLNDVIVIPVQHSQVDWNVYIKTFQDYVSHSPTRGIDEKAITTKEPAAFLKTLDFMNQPLNAIRSVNLYRHSFASFIIITNLEIILDFSELLNVSCTYFPANYGYHFAIVSADIEIWFNGIRNFTKDTTALASRQILNMIKRHLERGGYAELWEEYEELQRSDCTFVLRHK